MEECSGVHLKTVTFNPLIKSQAAEKAEVVCVVKMMMFILL